MLELRNIVKHYPVGSGVVEALKGIDLTFRESEFVSILGPSGCGKTTLLNIIGGLDGYTSGDLIINGKSTKDFKDRDWDTYRNHSVGFVFQSYNLIPHQTVLQNVELALTLSGVSKAERRKRARQALEEVGLGDQLDKKPTAMSGGQMQRVAIARAIVNDPDIILADEPTGALDTETSVQVMEILKGISQNRLVVMVTHNPDLAEQYSTRIVRMLDGRLTDDSAPLSEEEQQVESQQAVAKAAAESKKKKPSMSFVTSFGLSLKNLFTKKGRTALTSFAGSIGIIGIALIFAVSQGTTLYVNHVQEETLSSYPLVLEAQQMDMSTLIETFMGKARSIGEHEKDAVYQKAMFYEMMNALNNSRTKQNDLKSFKTFLANERAAEESKTGLKEAVSGVQYAYKMNLLVYTKNVDGEIIPSDSQKLMRNIMREYMGANTSSETSSSSTRGQSTFGGSSMMGSRTLWQEMLPGDNGKLINPILEKQYDVVYGSWPTQYNEVVLVLDKNNELDDMSLYALGLKSADEIENMMKAVREKTEIEYEEKQWSYPEICAMDFRVILNYNCYTLDETTGTYADLRDTKAGLQYLYDNGFNLKVSGIIRPSENASSTMLTGSIGYTSKLTEYVIEHAKESTVVQKQLEDPATDVFTGLPFKDTDGKLDDAKKVNDFKTYLASLDEKGKAEAYIKIMSIPSEEMMQKTVTDTMQSLNRQQMEQTLSSALTEQMGMKSSEVEKYVAEMSDEEMQKLFENMIRERFKQQYAEQIAAQFAQAPPEQLAGALDKALSQYTDEQCVQYYDEVLTFSESSYEDNLSTLGCVDLDNPSAIYLYTASFEDKDLVKDAIQDYNESVNELQEISYTDYVGLLMSSVTTIINAITYVLIAFVAVSLIVSSIMIGVITLISVQERTKEIGILRAIGASKKNVSSMFNAETVIIGMASGLFGVGITYLLCIPINMILHRLTDIHNLSAYLPPHVAVVLVLISMFLTLIAGIIPSRSAAKKDPVVALRSE